jgi:hypothetical protein
LFHCLLLPCFVTLTRFAFTTAVMQEPDSTCTFMKGAAGCGRFWNRSAADFYDLIDDTVRTIKAYDQSLQVGADGVANARTAVPTTSRPHPDGYIIYPNTDIICSTIKGPCDLRADMTVSCINECEGICNSTRGCVAFVSWASANTPGTPFHCQLKRIDGPGTFDPTKTRGTYVRVADPGQNPYSFGLIAELGKRKTPIDFFSWHGYIDQTEWYTDTAIAVRRHLVAAGLGHVKQHVTEWFPCILCPEQDTFGGAAAFGGTLTKLIKAGVSLATMYPACSMDEGNKTGGKGWGLFDSESVPGKAIWRPLTHTYAQFGELMLTTPHKMTANVNGLDETGFTVLAGRTELGARAATLKLLIASQHSNFSTVQVVVSGLPPPASMRYSVVLTNQSVIAGGIGQVSAAGVLMLPPFEAKPPAVAFVRIEQETNRLAVQSQPAPAICAYAVAVAPENDTATAYAATQLSRWLSVAGRCAVPVVASSAAVHLQVAVQLDATQGAESFRLQARQSAGGISYSVEGGSRGVIYGAYELLERVLGFQFLAKDVTTVPPLRLMPQLPHLDIESSPAFAFRSLGYASVLTKSGAEFSAVVRDNSIDWKEDAKPGQGVYYANPPGGCHTAFRLIPPAKYQTDHPDWFGGFVWDAKGSLVPTQLCWAAPGLVAALIEAVKTDLQFGVNRNATVVSVSQNDGGTYCNSSTEMAVIDAEGSPAGPLLRAVCRRPPLPPPPLPSLPTPNLRQIT